MSDITGSQASERTAIIRSWTKAKAYGHRNVEQQLWRKGTPQIRKGQRLVRYQVRQPGCHYSDSSNGFTHRYDTTAKPTHSAWKANIGTAHCICCLFDASRGCSHPDDLFNRC
ncbi:hypothetical protein [Mesorhizobium japonicum]|uniref:hypothetical protein n=1 Tax=Mesorhizobium japonicum TaxID=2066070 RepID=UPI00032574D3|nr:hypothetical protein [Mesorhizobium japonicum]